MLIDTHCHLDATEFDGDRAHVFELAVQAGVIGVVIPAVEVGNFEAVRQLAYTQPAGAYALGIHPLYVQYAQEHDLEALKQSLDRHRDDPKLVAVGEIGLDLYEPALKEPPLLDKQIAFFKAQLALAKSFDLPVILHVRRAQDLVLKYLRQAQVSGGIAHAFNGSFVQAQHFIDLGFALGMGGAMTYTRALQIRRLATQIPLEHLVLETDAPDIAPEWIKPNADTGTRRNAPDQVKPMAQCLAQLRHDSFENICRITTQTAQRVLPKLAQMNESCTCCRM